MYKVFAAALACMMVISLAGCGLKGELKRPSEIKKEQEKKNGDGA